MFGRSILASGALVLCLVACSEGLAGRPSLHTPTSQFLRLVRDGDNSPVALEAAIVRHVPLDRRQISPTVDLISAVHIADKSYYAELNRLFRQYDAVLYELVAPEGTQIPKGGGGAGTSPVSMLQRAMTGILELEFQLNGIDYTCQNMVHADMSPQQFARSMRQRGESMLQVFFRLMGYAMSRQDKNSIGAGDAELLLALFEKDRALAIKRVIADQFEDLEGSLTAINGPEGSTLITERNKVALEVLRKEIAASKQKIAIFYGAGHMPDLQQRLREDYGLVPISARWLVAWKLRAEPRAEEPARKPDHKPLGWRGMAPAHTAHRDATAEAAE